MAKSRNRKKKNVKPLFSPKKYIIEKARTFPIHKCYLGEGGESGMYVAFVSRKQPSGKFLIASFVLDIWCLGIKNTLYEMGMDDEQMEELLEKLMGNLDYKLVDPNYIQNLIYGALEYAEDLGFKPNRDFNITEYVLDPADELEFIDIEFGKNGRPFYFAGPYDNVDKIIATLERNVGSDNFDFILPMGDDIEYVGKADSTIGFKDNE